MQLLASLLFPLLLLSRVVLWSDEPVTLLPPTPLPAEESVRRADLPWRDLQELAVRVKGVPMEDFEPASVAPPAGRSVGERTSFWVADQPTNSYLSVEATLQVVTPHAYMYVEEGLPVDLARLREAARSFDERIYQGTRGYFGPEPERGLDGDHRVTILHASIPGLGGYFSGVDQYPRAVHPYSNERKILYINARSVSPGTAEYHSILTHEFQHMIHWNVGRGEQTWVKEGAAEVAVEAAGLGASSAVGSFERKPDTQLNGWADGSSDVVPHYGAAYLFLSYILEQFGGYGVAAELLGSDRRGADTFDDFLGRRAGGLSFENVFRDWVVANYLDERGARDPRHRYRDLRVDVRPTERVVSSTGWRDRTVRQFGADYLEVGGRWSAARIRFQGEQTTRVIPAEARSGRFFWWSNRGDMVDTSLTRAFDLRGLSSATLSFWSWYDLEEGFDYAYIMVSGDHGESWSTLPATTTTRADPNGNNLGDGFNGRSGGGDAARWVEQAVDLSPYVGSVVLVRFQLVTDDAFNAPGFAVDAISLPEAGYLADGEEDAGWFPMGFVRTDGVLPQRFSLQLIRFGDPITVEEVPLSFFQGADLVLDNRDGRLERAVLVISGLTRHTTEPAHYRYSVELTP